MELMICCWLKHILWTLTRHGMEVMEVNKLQPGHIQEPFSIDSPYIGEIFLVQIPLEQQYY